MVAVSRSGNRLSPATSGVPRRRGRCRCAHPRARCRCRSPDPASTLTHARGRRPYSAVGRQDLDRPWPRRPGLPTTRSRRTSAAHRRGGPARTREHRVGSTCRRPCRSSTVVVTSGPWIRVRAGRSSVEVAGLPIGERAPASAYDHSDMAPWTRNTASTGRGSGDAEAVAARGPGYRRGHHDAAEAVAHEVHAGHPRPRPAERPRGRGRRSAPTVRARFFIVQNDTWRTGPNKTSLAFFSRVGQVVHPAEERACAGGGAVPAGPRLDGLARRRSPPGPRSAGRPRPRRPARPARRALVRLRKRRREARRSWPPSRRPRASRRPRQVRIVVRARLVSGGVSRCGGRRGRPAPRRRASASVANSSTSSTGRRHRYRRPAAPHRPPRPPRAGSASGRTRRAA